MFWREAPAPDGEKELPPVLYLHGVPTNSDDWTPWLALTGGVAVDLPGFGRSGKPGSLNYTIEEYDAFIERFLDWRGIDRVRLVMHDWGGVGLAFAQRRPERVQRMALINLCPSSPVTAGTARPASGARLAGGDGDGRHRRRYAEVLSREANVTPGPLPEEMRRSIIDHLDQGTERAILRLYRSSPPERLAAAGAHLGDVRSPDPRRVGHARPLHPRALRRATTPRRSQMPSCSSCPTPATGPGSIAPICRARARVPSPPMSGTTVEARVRAAPRVRPTAGRVPGTGRPPGRPACWAAARRGRWRR